MKTLLTYYEISNTINERESKVTSRWATLEQARKGLKDSCDWYCSKGTGTLYEVTITENENNGSITVTTKRVW